MKSKTNILNKKFPEIASEINKMLKEKFNISGVAVSEIHFAQQSQCPPGFEKRCQFFGNDPKTGQPIIKCSCVPIEDV